jgi:hypothetical protein
MPIYMYDGEGRYVVRRLEEVSFLFLLYFSIGFFWVGVPVFCGVGDFSGWVRGKEGMVRERGLDGIGGDGIIWDGMRLN